MPPGFARCDTLMTTPGANNDRQTYEAWVHAHAAELFRFAFRLTSNRDVAEELVQDTFLEAWRGRAALREKGAARAWLFSILRHRFSRYLRSKPPVVHIDVAGPKMPEVGSRERSHPDQVADADALQCGLDALDESVRLPFVMVFIEGRSCKETSEALGIPFGTVLSRLSRARAAIRSKLAGFYDAATPKVDKVSPGPVRAIAPCQAP